MIAAIEQIKWKRDLKVDEDQVESDEEINNLKQRIRLRRRQKQEEKRRKMWEIALMNEKKVDSKLIGTHWLLLFFYSSTNSFFSMLSFCKYFIYILCVPE